MSPFSLARRCDATMLDLTPCGVGGEVGGRGRFVLCAMLYARFANFSLCLCGEISFLFFALLVPPCTIAPHDYDQIDNTTPTRIR